MRRRKSLIRRLLPWAIAAAIIAALVVFVGIPLYGQQEEEESRPPVIAFYGGDGKPLTMENGSLLFEMDPKTTQFTLTEKESGRMWRSNPEDAENDPIARAGNKELLSSTLVVTYTTSSGETVLNNYAYCIANQSYTVNPQEDGSIRVDYSVGKIDRVYQIPSAITVERYKTFTGAMSGSTRKKVSGSYTLVEPEKLDKNGDREATVAMYPSVTEQPLYILKSSVNAKNKEKLEGYFAEGGYNAEEYAIDQELVAGTKDNTGAVFNVSVIYRLENRDLVVEIPYSEIRYKSAYPITYVSPLPMFGAAGTGEEGYLFVPEGGGALIRYNSGKLNQNPYYANLYGWDYGLQRKEAVSETEDGFPVFGATHDGGAFICIMEGASSYAGVNADIAGRYDSYNHVYARYTVLHAEQYNVSAKTAQLVYIYEKEVPEDTIRQRYRFIQSTEYADLANAYGEYLCERYPEMAAAEASEDVPVNVELIGAIDKKVVRFGLPMDCVIPTTTFAQARKIVDELAEVKIGNLNVRMTGWANGGVRQKVLTGVHTLSELGGDSGLSQLIAEANQNNVNLSLDGITCFAYNSGLFDGFSPFNHAARYATREQVRLYDYSIVTYQPMKWRDGSGYYLVRPGYAKQNASNLIRALREKKAAGIAFRDIGNLLSADYYPRELTQRERVRDMNVETMKEAAAAGLRVTIREGNDYAVPYADLITDMNLTGQNYAILDERIPFYQIALHGRKDYTGEAINLSGDFMTTLLECAEFGAGLNFTFMAEDTRVLQDSFYSCYTASGYENWKAQILPMIQRYQRETAGLNRQKMTGHKRLAENVVMTMYEDGTKIYVNYGRDDYTAGSLKLPARDYKVERGNGR